MASGTIDQAEHHEDRAPTVPGGEGVMLSDLVDRWVADGLISAEQGAQLRGSHPRPVSVQVAGHARSVLVEALGYLGGAILVTAVILLAGLFWGDLQVAARIALLTGATAALALGGNLIPAVHGAATGRLRSALWVGAVVAAASTLEAGAAELGLNEADAAVAVAWGTTALAGVLWYRWRTAAQQIATMLAAAAGGAAVIAQYEVPDETVGLGVWTVGVIWALLAWCGLTLPGWLGRSAGSAMAVVGGMTTATGDPGTGFVIATLVVLLAAALSQRDPLMLGIAAIGVVVNVPAAADRWFPGSVAVPLSLLAIGTLLVLAATTAALRGRGVARNGGTRDIHDNAELGSPAIALATASVVVGTVAAAVATIARG